MAAVTSAETKTFRTDVVLTVATGTAMGNMTIADVHQLVGWLAGGPVWTHQLSLLREEAAQAAQAALGWAYEPFDPDREHHADYARRMVTKLGTHMQISPAMKPFHRADAVVADAVEIMRDPSKVIVVGVDRG